MHFIEYKKMWPFNIKDLKLVWSDRQIGRDEHILYLMMKDKNYKILAREENNNKSGYYLYMPNGDKNLLDTSVCNLTDSLAFCFHVSQNANYLFRSVSPFDMFDTSKKVLTCHIFYHTNYLQDWLILVKENPLYKEFFEVVGRINNEKSRQKVVSFLHHTISMAFFAVENKKAQGAKL